MYQNTQVYYCNSFEMSTESNLQKQKGIFKLISFYEKD